MKKILFLLMFAGALLASCEKDQPGGTTTRALAGEWYVIVDGVDNEGKVVYEDPFGAGRTMLYTYNTAADVPTEMYVDDQGSFWEYKVRVKSNIDALTFDTDGTVTSEYLTDPDPDEEDDEYYADVTIEGGRVIPKGTITPHGTPADSIVFYVRFSDDGYIPDDWDKMRVSGYRYTGLAEDE